MTSRCHFSRTKEGKVCEERDDRLYCNPCRTADEYKGLDIETRSRINLDMSMKTGQQKNAERIEYTTWCRIKLWEKWAKISHPKLECQPGGEEMCYICSIKERKRRNDSEQQTANEDPDDEDWIPAAFKALRHNMRERRCMKKLPGKLCPYTVKACRECRVNMRDGIRERIILSKIRRAHQGKYAVDVGEDRTEYLTECRNRLLDKWHMNRETQRTCGEAEISQCYVCIENSEDPRQDEHENMENVPKPVETMREETMDDTEEQLETDREEWRKSQERADGQEKPKDDASLSSTLLLSPNETKLLPREESRKLRELRKAEEEAKNDESSEDSENKDERALYPGWKRAYTWSEHHWKKEWKRSLKRFPKMSPGWKTKRRTVNYFYSGQWTPTYEKFENFLKKKEMILDRMKTHESKDKGMMMRAMIVNCTPIEIRNTAATIVNRYMGINSTISLMNSLGKLRDSSEKSIQAVREMVEKKYDWIRDEDFNRVIRKWKNPTPRVRIPRRRFLSEKILISEEMLKA